MAIASDSPPVGSDSSGDGAGVRPPPRPVATSAPEDKRLAWARELTTMVLAAAIVAVALTLLTLTFDAAVDFAQKKDVMLYGLTLVGTVIGFYFGRVPAERRAEASEETAKQAQSAANEANVDAAKANDKLREVRVGVERVKGLLTPASGSQRKTLGSEASSPGGQPEAVSQALLELESLARRL